MQGHILFVFYNTTCDDGKRMAILMINVWQELRDKASIMSLSNFVKFIKYEL